MKKERYDKEFTTITVQKSTWKFLNDHRRIGESLDKVLRRLLGIKNTFQLNYSGTGYSDNGIGNDKKTRRP